MEDGNDEEIASKQTLEEQKSAILTKAKEITEGIIELNEAIKSIQKNRLEKDKRLRDLKLLEHKVEESLANEEDESKVDENRLDQANIQEERSCLLDSIKEDMLTINKYKNQIRQLKEEDVNLAMEADILTDKEMAMLDLKRLTLHSERKEKRRSMTFEAMNDNCQCGKARTSLSKTDHRVKEEENLPTIVQAYKSLHLSSQDSENPKGARRKTSYLNRRNFEHDGYDRDNHDEMSRDDSLMSARADNWNDGNPTLPSRRRRGGLTPRQDAQNAGSQDSDDDGRDTFARFAKMMGDNLVALRKIHERPPKWSGPRIKVYSGKARENLDDFEDDIRASCNSLGITSNRERVRYMKGFLDGEASEFVSTLSTSGRYTLDEVFQKMQERFKDNRSQTDFLYMFTMRRQDPKTETIREYSHGLYTLVTKAYANMPDAKRMEVLKQKFLSSIKVEDLERTAMTHDLTSATYNQEVNIMSRMEEFRRTKEKCQQKIDDEWYVNNLDHTEQMSEQTPILYSRGEYRPRIPDTRTCHYCQKVGHLAYRCPQRLEDRKNGVERDIHWPPQRNGRKICSNCGGNNHSRQDCRKAPDYKPSTAFEGLPYQTADKTFYKSRMGEQNNHK